MSSSPTQIPESTADERISAIARFRAEETALIARDRQVTFTELEHQTSGMAARLAERGIGRGDTVAVRLNSCLEIVPLVRAILRLGAILTPLDPTHPAERVEFVLHDAGARALVTSTALAGQRLLSDTPVLPVEMLDGVVPSAPAEPVTLQDPACILYTSGSTGQPKGVVRVHRGIVSRLAWVRCNRDDVFCHNMSLCYGFSQERLLLPLMLGVPIAIFSDACHNDPRRFAEEVQAARVTQITVVPEFLDQLLDPRLRLHQRLGTVRSVTVGSAFLAPETIERFHQVLPQARLVNVYGSTESGTLTYGEMTQGEEANVGIPAPNMDVVILDDDLQPVSPGEVGEVCGGGPSLAAGYWRQPDLTAQRFIANPLRHGGGVLYRTGDRGRFLSSGRVQLVGRADRQVKVRGHRVELAEVEAALLKFKEVREAVVNVRPLETGHRLIAYVCPQFDETVSLTALRRHLHATLPRHMFPSAYVVMTELPRTAIGKVDVSALPQPGSARTNLETPYSAPRTPLEDAVAAVWAEVLQKDCVGRDDHFLDLGGDSINAVEIAAALEECLGVPAEAASCFELPTVTEMARWLQQMLANEDKGGPCESRNS